MKVIGQKNLTGRLRYLLENDKFPRFAVLEGRKGSGKKQIIKEVIRPYFDFVCFLTDSKVDTVRKMVQDAYKNTTGKGLYVLCDADEMSIAAKNALLKVTEETPNKSYFIVTVQNIENLSKTILSRSTVFYIDSYTKQEIRDYVKQTHADSLEYIDLDVFAECENIGEVDLLMKNDPNSFVDYVNLTLDNVAAVSEANAFKISSRIALKGEEDKYDLYLFLKMFSAMCLKRCDLDKDSSSTYLKWAVITNNCLKNITMKSLNKQMFFDIWIMDIRRAA